MALDHFPWLVGCRVLNSWTVAESTLELMLVVSLSHHFSISSFEKGNMRMMLIAWWHYRDYVSFWDSVILLASVRKIALCFLVCMMCHNLKMPMGQTKLCKMCIQDAIMQSLYESGPWLVFRKWWRDTVYWNTVKNPIENPRNYHCINHDHD